MARSKAATSIDHSPKTAEQLRVFLSTEEARAAMMAHSPVSDLNFLIRRLFLHERNELVEIL
jgi:hypothetical protein